MILCFKIINDYIFAKMFPSFIAALEEFLQQIFLVKPGPKNAVYSFEFWRFKLGSVPFTIVAIC